MHKKYAQLCAYLHEIKAKKIIFVQVNTWEFAYMYKYIYTYCIYTRNASIHAIRCYKSKWSAINSLIFLPPYAVSWCLAGVLKGLGCRLLGLRVANSNYPSRKDIPVEQNII